MTDLPRSFALGDMHVGASVSPKMVKALATIAELMHPTFDQQPWIAFPGKSKESCVLCSLTVRDFLRMVGFADARIRTVMVLIQSIRNGEMEHSLGIGVPYDKRKVEGRWAGHMVTEVPSEGVLIDTTLYGAIRPQWPDLNGMLALPLPAKPPKGEYHGCPMIVGAGRQEAGYEFGLYYFDRPELTDWRKGNGDGHPSNKHRRTDVASVMAQAYWKQPLS